MVLTQMISSYLFLHKLIKYYFVKLLNFTGIKRINILSELTADTI